MTSNPFRRAIGGAADRLRHAPRRRREPLPGGAERFGIERDLRVIFQPVIDLRDHSVTGVEALARFGDDEGASPRPWFSRAWEEGHGPDLELCSAVAALEASAALPNDVYLAVNLSAATALDRRVRALVDSSPRQLVIEITEHEVVEDYPTLDRAVSLLRSAGGSIAVDDAGAGWASLRHILELRPEIIKLDISLTRRVATELQTRAMTAALVRFAADVESTIVAEGVETPAQARALRDLGVTHGQGFGLGRPGPLVEILERQVDLTDW